MESQQSTRQNAAIPVEEGFEFRRKKTRGRGVAWRPSEIRDLLDVWGERRYQSDLQDSYRNIEIFEDIAREMATRGHRRTAEECRTKTKRLRLEYRNAVAANKRTGSSRVTCPYYEELARILGGDASAHPSRVVASLRVAEEAQEAAANIPPAEGKRARRCINICLWPQL